MPVPNKVPCTEGPDGISYSFSLRARSWGRTQGCSEMFGDDEAGSGRAAGLAGRPSRLTLFSWVRD